MTAPLKKLTRTQAIARRKKDQPVSVYFGKVCIKHPLLAGRRYLTSGCCTGCTRDRSNARYKVRMEKDPTFRAKTLKRKAARERERYATDAAYRAHRLGARAREFAPDSK